jgi:hypothetical protein
MLHVQVRECLHAKEVWLETLRVRHVSAWLQPVGKEGSLGMAVLAVQEKKKNIFESQPRDLDFLRSIRTHLKANNQPRFSADDFRYLGLDRFVEDPVHDVGAWFARMQRGKYIMPVGRKRSTQEKRHMAVNRVYELTGKDLL